MNNLSYILLGGLVVSLIINIFLISKVNNSEINIKRQVQKNRNSPDNVQEYNATNEKKGFLKRLKFRKNEKQ